MAKLLMYDSERDYHLGHNSIFIKKDNDINKLIDIAKEKLHKGYGSEIASIISHDYEGFIGELRITKEDLRDNYIISDYMYLSPDLNYKGDIDNDFYGTLEEYKERNLNNDLDR